MEGKWKKMWPLLATSLVAFTSTLSAGGRTAAAAAADNEMYRGDAEGPDMVITPPMRPKPQNEGRAEITVSGIYWNAHEDGLEFAVSNENNSVNPVTLNNAELLNLDFKWDPGFQLGIGYTVEHDGWDVNLMWTHIRNRGHKHADSAVCSSASITPLFNFYPSTVPGETPLVSDIDAHWRLKLDYLDLELGREFWVSKWLTLRPFVGFRGAWIKQDYNLEYCGGIFTTISPPLTLSSEMEMNNNFKGGGLRSGLNTQWCFGEGFCIYGNAALSIIYGRFSVDMEQDNINIAAPPFPRTDVGELESHFHLSTVSTDLALGLRYMHTFGDRRNFNLMISLGWEHHVFFDQNQLWEVPNTGLAGMNIFIPQRGNLTLQGWTLSFSLDF